VPLVEQAGAIVIAERAGQPAVLLVTGKRNPAHWVFPKGHVEPGETLEDAALREAEEEAGIAGDIVRRAGTIEFEIGRDTFRVHYFLVRTEDKGRPEPGRRLAWFSYEKALAALPFENSRALLRSVWPG
jgi:diadenosine hexaphosphate hydrolase (ATP-forming)